MPKIHVMRTKMIAEVVVDPGSIDSVCHAASVLTSINAHVAGLDHATLEITGSRLARVDAPEPMPEAKPEPTAGDPMKVPANLVRTAETEPAAAE